MSGRMRRMIAPSGAQRERQLAEALTGQRRHGVRHCRSNRRNTDLADTMRILPTTLAELRPTLAELQTVSRDAAPVVRELRPAAVKVGPALVDTAA